jgi:predicted nucleotidyltransferase
LNYLLNAILRESKEKINTSPLEIDYIYTTIDEESGLNVFIPARLFSIKTVVKTAVKITQVGQNIIIELIDFKIGRISFASEIVKRLMAISDLEAKIKTTLESNGIEAELDLNKFSFTITTNQVQKTILEALKEDENLDLYKTVFSMFLFEDKVLNINFGLDNKAGAKLDLQKMTYDETVDGKDDIDYNIASVVTKVETMLNNNSLSEKDLSAAFRYLLLGYQRIKDQDLVIINKIDFSSVGISSKSTYQGIIPQGNFTMADVFNSITLADLLINPGWLTIRITETDLNKIFLGMDLVGTAFAFPYLESGEYRVSYIALSSFYVDIFQDIIEIKLVLDVNGKETIIKTEFTGTKNQDLKIELNNTF